MAKVYSLQPRFKKGSMPGGWALVDAIFQVGIGKRGLTIPPYGVEARDMYTSLMWVDEPMTSGAFSTWVEKVQTVEYKIIGGKQNARFYATMFANSDNGLGWSWHQGMCALDYLVCDKGSIEELGRQSPRATVGRVMGIQHVDAARCIKTGKPGKFWRYYPEAGSPVDIPDDNLIQICGLPQGRDRFRGLGYCAMSRVLEAKQLMLGYLIYYRQEIGDLPSELVVIINGLPASAVEDSLAKYKANKEAKGHTTYGKIWWLGSDNVASPVSLDVQSLTVPNKSFNYQTMTEWYAKILALVTGEDVGEYWLLQTGESKTVQSVQHQKAKGKGHAKYLQEKERRYNLDILPYEVRLEYDNADDEQDRARADILSVNITNLKIMATIGLERQDFVFTVDEIRQLASLWGVIPEDMSSEEVPHVIGSMLKEVSQGAWVVTQQLKEYYRPPMLKNQEARDAMTLYNQFQRVYGLMNGNSYMQHKQLEDVRL